MLLNVLSLVSNVLIIAATAGSLIRFFTKGGDANMKVKAKRCFMFFTVDSNVLVSLTSAVILVFNIIGLITGSFAVPAWAAALKLVGTTAVMLTFTVVVTMLAPFSKDGYFSLFEGAGFFMHFLTPVLAAVSFIVFERGAKLSYLMILPSLAPTLVYAVVYFIKVKVITEKNGGWEDFYGFNKGGKWYVFAPIVFALTALLAFVLILLHNLCA